MNYSQVLQNLVGSESSKQMFKVLFLLMFCFIAGTLSAQSFQVNGKITDDQGESLIGVNVLNENSGNGTTTDFEGVFDLEATKGDLIVVSYVGYTTQRIPVEGVDQNWSIVLQAGADVLDEIVVVGYGK